MLKTEPLTNISSTNQPIIVLTSHSSQFPDSRPGEERLLSLDFPFLSLSHGKGQLLGVGQYFDLLTSSAQQQQRSSCAATAAAAEAEAELELYRYYISSRRV